MGDGVHCPVSQTGRRCQKDVGHGGAHVFFGSNGAGDVATVDADADDARRLLDSLKQQAWRAKQARLNDLLREWRSAGEGP